MANKTNPSSGTKVSILARLRKIFALNIGTVMFGFLFLYMAVSAILYMSSGRIVSYQVISGPLSRNETYTGLAIREETIVSADAGGYITYYAREGNKVNANGAVYALGASKSSSSDVKLSTEDLNRIRSQMNSFSNGFNPSNFNDTYSFKSELEGNILQYAGVEDTRTGTPSENQNSQTGSTNFQFSAVTLGNQTICKSQADGIILYSTDGYENKTVDTVTAGDFDQNSYHKEDLKTKDQIKAGQDVYTIITDEEWNLLIPLSDKQAVNLADRTAIRVKFLKDGMSQSGDFQIREIDGSKYGQITFNKGLMRYASDRFLDIELVTNSQVGLKIPLTSILTKNFYLLPESYLTMNEEDTEAGYMKLTKEKGKEVQTFVPVTIYGMKQKERDDELKPGQVPNYLYYIDMSVFQDGDVIINPETREKYIIGDTGKLDGVYCMNKGYAVFRCIDILDQNEEFAIVDDSTEYGLVRYDHIVQDCTKVKEQDILF